MPKTPNSFTNSTRVIHPEPVLNVVRIWILLSTLLVCSGWVLSAFHELNRIGYAVVFALAAAISIVWQRKAKWCPRKSPAQLLQKFKCRFSRPAPLIFLYWP
jgi:hypothetical protein